MRNTKYSLIFTMVLSIGFMANCSKMMGDDEDDDDEASIIGTNSYGSVSETNLGDLGLSDALDISVSDSVSASGSSSLALLSSKSREACEIRQTVKGAMEAVEQVASMFCHFEVESDTIEFGKKYEITFADEDEKMQLWIDDTNQSEDGSLVVYFCEAGTLQQKITLQGASDGAALGEVLMHGGDGEGDFARSAKFDNGYSDEGIAKIMVKSSFEGSDNGSFREVTRLHLEEEGVSKISVSRNGTWEGSTFADAGGAFINDDFGMAIYAGLGTDPGGNDYDWVHSAYFDAAGQTVASDATTDFDDGGDLKVNDKNIPGFLPDDFAVASFADTDWDCTGGEALTIGDNAANISAHDSCDGDRADFEYEDCWDDSAYAEGDDHSLDDSEREDAEGMDL